MTNHQPTPRLHWLTAAVAQTGLLGHLTRTEALEAIPWELDVDDAWERASAAFRLSQEQIAKIVAAAYRLEAANTQFAQPEAASFLPEEVARELRVAPLRITDWTLVVATADPLDTRIEKRVEALSGRRAVLAVAGPTAITAARDRLYGARAPDEFVLSQLHLTTAMQRVELPAAGQSVKTRSAPVERLIRLILFEAVMAGADEIRLEPRTRGGRVRFRIGNETRTFVHLPVAAILRVMARLRSWDPSASRPDATRVPARVDGRPYELEVKLAGTESHDPIHLAIYAGDAAAAPATPTVEHEIQTETDGAPRALVVDDDPGDRMLLRSSLRRAGFVVTEAADGLEALGHLQGDVDFDVMLLDLLMPKLPGLGVLERVRKTVRTAGLPVVVITASRDEAHKREILAAGADDYLEKPIDPAKIASRVKALLRRSMATTP